MKKSRKLLSVLLLVAMCFSVMAVPAFADNANVVIGGAIVTGEGNAQEGGGSAVIVGGTNTPAPSSTPDNSTANIIIGGTNQGGNDGKLMLTGVDDQQQADKSYAEGTVAVIGDTEYATIGEAIKAAAGKELTVKLVKDLIENNSLTIGGSMTLDLNGKTLRFVPTQNVTAAITVTAGTVLIKKGDIVINNTPIKDGTGSVGFGTGIISEGTLTLTDVKLSYSAPSAGGLMMAKGENKGSITVIDGSYSADPSAFLPEGYSTAADNEGRFHVFETPELGGATPAPAASNVAKIGDTEYATLAAAVTAAVANDTIVLLDNVMENFGSGNTAGNFTLDLNAKTLTGGVGIATGMNVTIKNGTVAGDIMNGGSLTLDSVAVSGNIENTGSLTLKGSTSVPGTIQLGTNTANGSGSSLNVSEATVSAGNISVVDDKTAFKSAVNISAGSFGTLSTESDSVVTGNVTGGSFAAQVPAAFIASGYRSTSADGKYGVEPIPATGKVTDGDGKEISYVSHFKGASEANNNYDMSFKTDPALTSLSVGNTALAAGTDYTVASNGTITIAKDAAFLGRLPAGVNKLSFTLENGAVVDVNLNVWPSAVFSRSRYVQGSGTNLTVNLSDAPLNISVSTSNSADSHRSSYLSSSDYTVSSNSYTIKSEYLDKLSTGTQYIGFWYDCGVLLYAYTIAPAPSVAPIEANKDAKWLNSTGTLGFNVSPDVQSITVDGSAVSANNYSVSNSNVLTLSSAFLKTLSYGEHTLAVTTSDGTASTRFTTAPSVVARNGSNHTKGGSNDLAFVASDAMNQVYVGRTLLTSTQYTLSSDGKTITLRAAFLNTLNADTNYVLTVNGPSGSATATFRILSASSAAANPQTGDESSLVLWAAVMLLSGAAVVALIPKKRKQ